MTVIIISALACIGTIAVALVKPQVKIKDNSVSVFFIPALLGALVLLFSGLLPWSDAIAGLTANSDINPLKILTLFLSMTLLSVFLDEIGFFKYLANMAVQKCGGKQIRLFVIFYAMVSVLTTFTSNDVVILTFTPFICYFSKNAKIDPIPYLVSEFVAANTASMFLIIGNPTNIYLATMAGIDFFTYLTTMAIPAALALITAFGMLFVIFRKRLEQSLTVTPENVIIEQKILLFFGLAVLTICTLMLTISGYVKFPMWLISVAGLGTLLFGVLAISLLNRRKPIELLRAIRRGPWEVVPLVISMFIIVLALENSGATEKIAELLNFGNTLLTYGISSTLAANLMNNIPMSVLFSSLITGSEQKLMATYAAVIGSNIGAYLTPIGALAGIMWLRILHYQGIKYGFGKFVVYGTCIATPTLFAALLGLYISLKIEFEKIFNAENIFSGISLIAIIVLLVFYKLREKSIEQKSEDSDSVYMVIWGIYTFIAGFVLYMCAFFQSEKSETQTVLSYILSKVILSAELSLKMFVYNFNYADAKELIDNNGVYCIAIVICFILASIWTSKVAGKLFFGSFINEIKIWVYANYPLKKTKPHYIIVLILKLIFDIFSLFSLKKNKHHYIIVGCENSMRVFLCNLVEKEGVGKNNITIITGKPIKSDTTYFKEFIENGYAVINGKTDEAAFKKAGIDNAKHKTRVIAITECDKQNLAVADIVTQKITSADSHLEAYIMYSFIERTEHFVFAENAYGKVDFFNPYELRARSFFGEHPITSLIPANFVDTDKARLKTKYLIKNIFIGFGSANYQMLKGSVLTGQLLGCDYNATIYDENICAEKPSIRQAMFMNHSSGLFGGDETLKGKEYFESPEEKYNINFKYGNVLSRDFYTGKDGLIQEVEKDDFTVIYIALGEDKLGIETACEIRQCLYEHGIEKEKVRIFVKICEEFVFGREEVINHENNIPIPIKCFGWNSSILTKDYIVNESLDKFAKELTNKNHGKSWASLTETKRDMNRQLTMAIRVKLNLLGFDLKDKTEKKIEDEAYYKHYIGDGNEKIEEIIELSKEIAKNNSKELKEERSRYILDYVKTDNEQANGIISDTPRNNLARLEHLRWNTFHLIHGWTKMPENEIGIGNNGRQNKLTKQHACITTFEELIKLRELQARKMREEDSEISEDEAVKKSRYNLV